MVQVSINPCASSEVREVGSNCSGATAMLLHADAAVFPDPIPVPNVPKPAQIPAAM